MQKAITYSSFAIASIIVVLVFLTAQTYSQLAVAVLLYFPLAYLALVIFPRRKWKVPIPSVALRVQMPNHRAHTIKSDTLIADNDKRAFLKLIGAVGLFFFASSFLGRKLDGAFFNKALDTGTNKITTPSQNQPTSNSQPFEGYRISEIDDGAVSYYGFINQEGSWMIMREDTNTSSFRYAKGDINFPANWAKRTNLKYGYYHDLF